MPRIPNAEALSTFAKKLQCDYEAWPLRITLSAGTCGLAAGSQAVLGELNKQIRKAGLTEQTHIRVTGCQGFCQVEPLLIVEPLGAMYCSVTAQDVKEIVHQSLVQRRTIDRLLYTDPDTRQSYRSEQEVPFYAKQDRVLMSDNRHLEPGNISDYLARGGYTALARAITSMTPDAVIEEILISGLRGRGGGGYNTGKKWQQCSNAPGEKRFVICNADEGDPGAYMDRCILEGNPHSVLEGMLVGAYAVGASEGFIYVRKEYPLAVLHTGQAIEQAYEYGFLGENIFDTGFDFHLRVVRGGGAFVCGESTALMSSLEGKVGEPRAKDVHTVERGYLNLPTNLNNVETWANVPKIINHGAGWFAARGTASSKGTKVFTLTGQVKNTGLVEVKMGVSLQEIIYDIGGGPKNGRKIKAVQTGGPSGGLIPASKFDLPVDFEALYDAGSMLGSGGMIVLDDGACMVDMAKYFLTFLQDESCGKCSACRIGVSRLLEIVSDISMGAGNLDQLDLLEDLAWTISHVSLCALGKTAPNPVLSTLRYFREEYEAHIGDRRCPAAVCQALTRVIIDPDECSQCGECAEECPHGAVMESGQQFQVDNTLCQKCTMCQSICPADAIQLR